MKIDLVFTLFLILSLNIATTQAQNHTVQDEILNGAPIKIVTPSEPDGNKAFFHVHGWRPADAPHEADLDLNDPFYKQLLENGWIIGRTAFLENGVDHDAHTKALYDLKNRIENEHSPIELLILEGESTAATLVLRIAEQNPDLADGVIAKAAFINLDDESADSYLTGSPTIPAILMSNLTELDGPVAYLAAAEHAVVPPVMRPLLRPGHVNVNWMERLSALDSVVSWIHGDIPDRVSDGTRHVPDRQTGTAFQDGALVNRVTAINPYFGNATLGYHPDELRKAGITQGSTFIFEVHGQQRDVFFGESYGDVPLGEWVAFPLADDQILIARNHQSAILTANLSVGDEVRIFPSE